MSIANINTSRKHTSEDLEGDTAFAEKVECLLGPGAPMATPSDITTISVLHSQTTPSQSRPPSKVYPPTEPPTSAGPPASLPNTQGVAHRVVMSVIMPVIPMFSPTYSACLQALSLEGNPALPRGIRPASSVNNITSLPGHAMPSRGFPIHKATTVPQMATPAKLPALDLSSMSNLDHMPIPSASAS